MKDINKLGKTTTKTLEIFHWIGTVLMFFTTLCSFTAPKLFDIFTNFDGKECCGTTLSVYGFDVNAPFEDGKVDPTSFLLFGIVATVILSIMALIFRYLHLIFKNSEKCTPFQAKNINMMRKIGHLAIAIPIIEFVMSFILAIFTATNAKITVNFSGILIGIIILCLTRFFIHGAELEKDVDGLL